ncbi:MAG: putative oxidoreductase [Acidobacteria bacterium]|nr:putative oxidoreductase [Acidobacteriota bacterium]
MSIPWTLDNRVAIVTGGSRGIGYAIADAMLSRGARVLVTGLDRSRLAAAREALALGGRHVDAVEADVRNADQAEAMVARAVSAFGGLDILVNNAGVGSFSPIAETTHDAWDRMIGTNLTGVFYCCKASIPHLRARGGGWIVNISSLAGKNSFVGGGAYCATKAGLNAFSEVLMQELRYDDIRVAYVMPGSVATEFGGARDSGDEWKIASEDVAQTVIDLVTSPARSLASRVELRPAKPPRR